MSAVNQLETDLLTLMFNNTDAPNFGDAGGLQQSVAPGSTRLALATAAFVETDTLMTANEIVYTGYVRPTQARSAGGWTISGAAPTMASNAALITFGKMTGGAGGTAGDVGIAFLATGEYLQIYGVLDSDLSVTTNVEPQFAIGALDITLD